MSAKKIADFIFEGTGRGVNALMKKFGLSKSATAKLSPDKLARVIQQKGTQFYKDGVKAGNINTGRLVVGASSIGAVLNQIWNEFDPTKVKKMGDGTLRAESLKNKKNGIKKKEIKKKVVNKKAVKKTPPKAPPPKPDSVKKKKNGVSYSYEVIPKGKYNKGGMLKKGKK